MPPACVHCPSIYGTNHRLLLQCCKLSSRSSAILNDLTVTVLHYIGNTYAQCLLINICSLSHFGVGHQLYRAIRIFDSIPDHDKDASLVNAMMKCYIHHSRHAEAVALYHQSTQSDMMVQHNPVSNTLFLKACVRGNHFEDGKKLIDSIQSMHTDEDGKQSIELLHSILHFYGHLGDMQAATHVFSTIPLQLKNSVSISAMMKCFIHNQHYQNAIDLFHQHAPTDDVSQLLCLKACVHADRYADGQALIQQSNSNLLLHQRSTGFLNAVMHFHSHFGDVDAAVDIFDAMMSAHKTDIVSINTLMTGYIQHEQYDQAMALFKHAVGVNDVSNMLFLKACVMAQQYEDGKALIDQFRDCLNERSSELINTAIHFCGHFGHVEDALSIFH